MRYLFVPALLFVLAAPVPGEILHVPGEYPTIQEAIEAAGTGDTILVAPGTYVENIDYLGKDIVVKSEQGPDVTVIDGGQPADPDKGSVVSFTSNEGPDAVLEGFTVTNGTGTRDLPNGDYYGGGINCNGASPTIRNNLITLNLGINGHENLYAHGAGLVCQHGASPLIWNNVISYNAADNGGEGGGGFGGGIYCYDDSNPLIENNLIAHNKANYKGGGIQCSLSDPMIRHNLIMENTAVHGGGIDCYSANPTITGNVIAKNSATYYYTTKGKGGGIHLGSTITSNLIYGNSAFADGGGIYINTAVLVANNTIIGNDSGEEGGGIYCFAKHPVFTNLIVRNNTAKTGPEIYSHYGNEVVEYSNISGGWPGTGNIDMDPLFIDAAHDNFHLSRFSPCINRGTNLEEVQEDLDGDARPHMGTTDMGADEFMGTHLLAADTFILSAAVGGTIQFTLNGGMEHAGREYLIFGSATGTAPGTTLPGGTKVLPINWDPFTTIVVDLNYPDSIVFEGFYGTLDSAGQASAAFYTNGPVPGTAGYTLSWAYPLKGPPWDLASNPINVVIVP